MLKLKDLLSKKITKKIDEASGTGSTLSGKKTPLKKMDFKDFQSLGKMQADSKKAAEKKDLTMKDVILGKQ